MAKGLLIAAMDFSIVAEDEFHDWYDTEHVPERLAVPGFINADRWIGIDNPKLSVATYDVTTVEQVPGLTCPVPQIITQRDVHKENSRQMIELLRRQGVRVFGARLAGEWQHDSDKLARTLVRLSRWNRDELQ